MYYPILFIILFVLVGVPVVLTLMNIILLFSEKKFKAMTVNLIDLTIFALGILYTVILAVYIGFCDWNVQIYGSEDKFSYGYTYTPISFKSLPAFITLCFVAVAGYALIRIFRKKLSPVIASLCYGGIFLGFCLTVALTIQMSCEMNDLITWLFLLFPYNYILCSARLMRNTVSEYAKIIADTNYKNKALQICKKILSRSASFMVISFFMSVPILFLVIIVLILFGQQPDSIIKAFTDTAEWTLSQKIPPPRLDWGGHYLCTVAACGDAGVVKPLRVGRRNNELIIVNRQLLIANAFEDLLTCKAPKMHRIIRKTYDRLGFPISKYITTKRRSDFVYFIMKPLEWLFLFVLYTIDVKPENRIHMQYLGLKN